MISGARRYRLYLASVMAGTALVPAAALAAPDDQIQEIVVTAQKRGESIQKVPISITALSSADIQEKGLRDALGLTQNVPGLQVNNVFQSSNPTIFLRGVGVNDYNPASSGAVGVTVDEVFLNSGVGQLFQLYDVDRIEVLKGPQGTLYGRNTTGGVLNFYTKQPSFGRDLSASLTYGRYNQVSFDGAAGGTIVPDRLAARLSVSVKRRDGYVKNLEDGRELNDIDSLAGRFQFLFTPTDRIEIKNKVEGGRSRTSAIAHKSLGTYNLALGRPCTGDEILAINVCANPLTGFADSANLNEVRTDIHNNYEKLDNFGDRLSIVWNGDKVSLTSISAYVWNRRRLNQDQDSSPFSILNSPVWTEKSEQVSQELRLASTGDGRLKWVVGLFYLHERLNSLSNFSYLASFNPTPSQPYFDPANNIFLVERQFTQKTDSFAGFGQLDYALTDKLKMTLGFRYTSDKKDISFQTYAGAVNPASDPLARLQQPLIGLIDSSPNDFSIDAPARTTDRLKKPTWRVALDYQMTPDILGYASYSRGVRSGGHNTGAVFFSGIEFTKVQPERLDAFEVGLKSDLLDRRLRVNLAAFHYDYKNMQVFSLESGPTVPLQRLQNADAEIYGGEMEVSATPASGLELNFGLAALHTEYTRFIDPLRGDFKGQRLDKAPSLQMTAGVQYHFALSPDWEGRIGGDFAYQSKVYFSPVNAAPMESDAHGQLNLKAGIGKADKGLDLLFFVNNVTNKRYLQDIVDVSVAGFYFGVYSEPRTYGLTLSYKM